MLLQEESTSQWAELQTIVGLADDEVRELAKATTGLDGTTATRTGDSTDEDDFF
jgi:hypothetical protein